MIAAATHATSTDTNLAVRAAAGTGKTWLLTSRLINLLLQGVPPGSILAITFTRKAAHDIYRRVSERLLDLVTADESELPARLHSLGLAATSKHLHEARRLFERLLSTEQELRTTTFHAFCQDVLRRFPLEAEVPPAFGILESTIEMERAAWRALEQEATANPRSPLAQAVDTLLQSCGGIASTRQALGEFLKHRSDWWAYTEGERDPVGAAESRLQHILKIVPEDDPAIFIHQDTVLTAALARYSELLGRHSTASNQRRLAQCQRACDPATLPAQALDLLTAVFLTTKAQPRRLRRGSRLEAVLGPAGVDELLGLHNSIITRLQQIHEQRLRLHTLKTTCAWYRCGQRLLEHYQRAKAQQGLLDFADLEWKTYRLLNASQHAEWIQYKLDQRIDHLLVDEFQDTNPTQWRLLLPLLTEMAAGKAQRPRSVFLVGDEKQSIYGFRRADPDLFNAAQDWLTSNMRAITLTQDKSWRSSPTIIEFVNLIFAGANKQADKANAARTDSVEDFPLQKFRKHETHHEQRWGRVELLSLIRWKRAGTNDAASDTLRNPLQRPRMVAEDERYRAEGQLVANKITQLVGQPIDDHGVRALEYGDIMLLLRDRTHAPAYEAALRDAAIPYVGAGRGTLVECLEVQDLMHLLQCLIAPYDNLALASALRCPIFACRDEDLTRLATAQDGATWRDRLALVAQQLAPGHALVRAYRLIERWAGAADKIPVHDLLDKIYTEGNVLARYVSTAPPHLKNRVQVNLRRLLELALEVDHGRYPSLMRFLTRLPILANEERYALAETFGEDRGHVRIMTIHAAKGLERPIVFLVDTMRDAGVRRSGKRALIDWPVETARPRHFRLVGKKEGRDSTSQRLLKELDLAVRREEANLLYVALTRAKHALFISACEPGRGAGTGWYGFIERRMRKAVMQHQQPIPGLKMRKPGHTLGAGMVLEQGTVPALPESPAPADTFTDDPVDPALTQPLAPNADTEIVYPSHVVLSDDRNADLAQGAGTNTGHTRGAVIHRMLTVLTGELDRTAVERRIANELLATLPRAVFDACWREACAVVDEPAFKRFFDRSSFQEARNEVPVLYRRFDKAVYGVIDRLVIYDNEIAIIDYKTHAQTVREHIDQLAHAFEQQMRLYAAGVRKLWPKRRLRVLLLFTAPRVIVDMTEVVSREP